MLIWHERSGPHFVSDFLKHVQDHANNDHTKFELAWVVGQYWLRKPDFHISYSVSQYLTLVYRRGH